jgi:hypothetical protein
VGLTQDLIQTQDVITATSLSLLATDSVVRTQLAIPTVTSSPTSTLPPTSTLAPTIPPQQTVCDAEVQGTSRAMYPVPGQGHKSFYRLVEPGTNIKILGRLGDNGWYKVEIDNEQGWMKSDNLQLLNSCRPTIYDLHYLANWLGPDEELVLEDTFSANANAWFDTTTQKNILANTTQQGESILNLYSNNEIVVTTTNPRVSEISAFKLYASFSVDKVNDQSYFGIRFRDTGNEFFQLFFSPATCKIDVSATNNLIFSNNMNLKTCIDRYYDMYISLTSDYKLEIQINGFEPISINLQDPDGRYSKGKIDLVANKINVSLDYIVITGPK